jgi:hypothetical protein
MEEFTCLINTPGLRISYDESNQWLYNQWLGRHDMESVPKCAELIHACLATNPCPKMLSDHSLLTGDWQPAIPTVQAAFACMASQGVAYIAWVHSPLYSDYLAMEKAMLHITCPTVAIFDDVYAAYAWLQRMPVHLPPVYRNKASEHIVGRVSV